MSIINEIQVFAKNGTTASGDVMSPADYAADVQTPLGHQVGIARRALANTAMRQVTRFCNGVAQFIAEGYAPGVVDDGDPQKIVDGLWAAIGEVFGADIAAHNTNPEAHRAFTTPPQFDADESPATTAFVQRALGNFRGLRGISESCTLTAADIGMLLVVGGAGPITINLPPATVCAPVSGAGFEFVHSGQYPVTLQCAGTDKIVLSRAAQGVSSFDIQPAETLAIKSAGSLYWYNHGGSAQLPYVARYETMWIGAGAMVPCKTNGATAGTNEYASSLLNVDYMEFGTVADTAAEAAFVLPQNWDKGAMRAKLHWVPALGTAVEGQYVGWKLAAGATGESTIANRNLWNLPFGGAVTVEDQVGPASTNLREHVSAASAPISCGATPQTGDRITLRVTRDADYAGAGAAMPVPAWLIGLEIQYRVVGRAEAWS